MQIIHIMQIMHVMYIMQIMLILCKLCRLCRLCRLCILRNNQHTHPRGTFKPGATSESSLVSAAALRRTLSWAPWPAAAAAAALSWADFLVLAVPLRRPVGRPRSSRCASVRRRCKDSMLFLHHSASSSVKVIGVLSKSSAFMADL